jgi:hypothetical protein
MTRDLSLLLEAGSLVDDRVASVRADSRETETTRMGMVPAEIATQFAAQRLSSHALTLAFDTALNHIVFNRFMYLLTAEHDVDAARFELLRYQHSTQELDVTLLRALADVMEALEDERCDARATDRAS